MADFNCALHIFIRQLSCFIEDIFLLKQDCEAMIIIYVIFTSVKVVYCITVKKKKKKNTFKCEILFFDFFHKLIEQAFEGNRTLMNDADR